MKTLKNLMQEIIEITTEIETKYPELYKYIDETPLTFSNASPKEIGKEELKNYLATLKEQLKDHIQSHQKK